MTAADYRITRVVLDGLGYTPIVEVATGRWLDQHAVTALAEAPAPTAGRRYFDFVLADESTPLNGEPALNLRRASVPAEFPIGFANEPLAIATATLIRGAPPGTTLGTVGRSLIARACMRETILAGVCWEAVRSGVLRGICARLGEPAEETEFRVAWLGPHEESCLPGARVLSWWEEAPTPGQPRPGARVAQRAAFDER